jgi:catechol 2,3-dioxygenase-like lactoylglutathione lyase family enzyme
VFRIAWLGVRAADLDRMVAFLRDIMGMTLRFAEESTAELSLPNDDRVQVFGPGHRYYDYFGQHADGPVALFEIDDVYEAQEEMTASGIEFVGSIESDHEWTWLHFRAPDGNLYALASRRSVAG